MRGILNHRVLAPHLVNLLRALRLVDLSALTMALPRLGAGGSGAPAKGQLFLWLGALLPHEHTHSLPKGRHPHRHPDAPALAVGDCHSMNTGTPEWPREYRVKAETPRPLGCFPIEVFLTLTLTLTLTLGCFPVEVILVPTRSRTLTLTLTFTLTLHPHSAPPLSPSR